MTVSLVIPGESRAPGVAACRGDARGVTLANMVEKRTRPRPFNIRVSDEELRMVKLLAEHLGLSQSDVMRQLLRQAFKREGLADTARTTRTNKRGKRS